MPTVLITGTNRGIGLGLVRHYSEAGWRVIAACRNPSAAVDLAVIAQANDEVVVERIDLENHETIDALAEKYAGVPIDVIINNAATVGPRDPNMEQIYRQKFGSLDYDAWGTVFRINTMGPAKVAEAFVSNLELSEQRKLVNISSSMGSITLGLSPVYLYNSAKAALNRVTSMLAVDLRDRGIICVAFCPGHVRTDLGGADAAVSVDESVSGMRKLISELTMDDTGTYTRYNGETVPW